MAYSVGHTFPSTRKLNRWSLITVTIVVLLALPILTILISLLAGPGESWGHVTKYLLPGYLLNTASLIMGCAMLSLLLSVIPAWLVSRYEFPLRGVMEWALILPLAIPNYLTAYAYAGIFDYSGPFQGIIRFVAGPGSLLKLDVMNIGGLIFVLSASLCPYIYVTARSFFLNQSRSQLKAAEVLGAGERNLFLKVALPMARPAIFGGLLLVLMEVLNDYGAAHYFGVNTFTTAIFRSWFSLEEPETAVYLSAILCLFVLMIIALEAYQRKNKRYDTRSGSIHDGMTRKSLSMGRQWFFLMICLAPVALGFIFPVVQMIYWAVLTWEIVWSVTLLQMVATSFSLALLSALLCALLSLLIIYGTLWSRSSRIKSLSKLAILGYAVPGAVIAVGIMIPTLEFDKWIASIGKEYFNVSVGLIINGTIIALVFAYCVRFLAVAFNPIEAGVSRLGNSMEFSAQTLGASKWKRMKRIHMPLLSASLLSAGMLVFVDVMKELPLTLLLKPYGIMTLSAKAFEFASDERIAESSLPALFIIGTGLIPVIMINRLLKWRF